MNNIFKPLSELKDKLITFAPMAGVSDAAYRGICSDYGANITYTEMVSALGIKYNPERCEEIRMRSPKEKICGMQLFGDDPKIMAKIAKEYQEPYDFIDVNMGCPAPKIVKNNQGSALMRNPELASDIIKAMTDAVDKPVTVKIRSGWSENKINAVEFAKKLEEAGAACVAVHGRHRQQFYAGKADLNIIKQVKRELKIPVIGNGDIFSAQDAVDMVELTKCDGVMVARGAQGNPFIFMQIRDMFNGEPQTQFTIEDKIKVVLEHSSALMEIYGEKMMALKMRKHLCWYSKGIKGAAELKKHAIKVETYEDIKNYCETLKSQV